MTNGDNEQGPSGAPEKKRTIGRNVLRLVISLVLILAGIGGARFLIATKPKVNRKPPARMAPLVEVMRLEPLNYILNVPAMGNVIPAREVSLEAQVAGEVIYMHPEFIEGGMISKGTKILQIDSQNYELAILQQQRALADAEYKLKLELGHQEVARKEWDLLYGDQQIEETESDLALRRPHLENVKAEISAAKAELEQAKLNLARTTLSSPFNALVLNRYVDLGSQVSPQERLADLVGSDSFWVQVSLPVERLKWVSIPNNGNGKGSKTIIIYRGSNSREGRVIRLLPDLSKEGRMARLLVEVGDPFGQQTTGEKQAKILIGEYVRVLIEGVQLEDVYRLPRGALHNDSQVWLVDDEERLEIRPVQTIWRDEESVVVKDGFKPGERLVVSSLAAPVAGMNLRVEEPGREQDQSEKQAQGNK